MKRERNNSLIGGLLLLGAGVLALIGQLTPGDWGPFLGTFLLLGLGLIFMVVGIFTRESGWFIPGGILTGIGAGVALLSNSWMSRLPGDEGGWFLLIFALGWLLIPVMSAIFSDETHWWALIPGGIIALVGAAVLFGGVFLNALEWVGKLWPLALIVAGALLLWKVRRSPDDETAEKHA